MKILKIFKIFEKIEIEKEIIREKDVNREGWRILYELSSGNQVDGLPLVAIPKQ